MGYSTIYGGFAPPQSQYVCRHLIKQCPPGLSQTARTDMHRSAAGRRCQLTAVGIGQKGTGCAAACAQQFPEISGRHLFVFVEIVIHFLKGAPEHPGIGVAIFIQAHDLTAVLQKFQGLSDLHLVKCIQIHAVHGQETVPGIPEALQQELYIRLQLNHI